MTGFELWTFGVGSNRSTNWVTTTVLRYTISLSLIYFILWIQIFYCKVKYLLSADQKKI